MKDKDFYIKYLAALLELNKMHSGKWEGRSLITPTLISEELCKYLLNLEDREIGAKDHDAIKDSIKYEIKATSDERGTTTFNPNANVDYCIWIFFNYKNEELVIKKTEFNNLKKAKTKKVEEDIDFVIKANEVKVKRQTIQLSNIKTWEFEKFYKMHSLEELKK